MLILITVFRNREDELVDCFKSIELIDKELRHFVRHVIVDGGSTDQSSNIVESYKNAGLIEVNSYTVLDESIYEGFNNGIKIAEELYSENDYVSFLHSDDTISPGINDAIRFLINERVDYLETITEYEVDGKIHIRKVRGRFSFFRAPFNHMSLIYRLGVHESLGYYPAVILSGRKVNDEMGIFVATKVIKIKKEFK